MRSLNIVSKTHLRVFAKPVPWSVPTIYRFGGSKPNPKLVAWQGEISKAARLAWGPYEPTTSPLSLHFTFWLPKVKPSDSGLVVPTIKRNPLTDKVTKRGLAVADLTNLAKGVEDAMEGIIFYNDVMTRHKEEIAFYADDANVGVSIVVKVLDPVTPLTVKPDK